MPELLAGFVCGYGLSLAVTPVAAIMVVRARVTSPLVAQIVPEGSSLIAASVVFHLFAVLTLTAIGLLLGLLLAGLEESSPAGGLGSPNRVFTVFILASTSMLVVPPALLWRRLRTPLLATGLFLIGCFGWLMPYLATWAPNQS